MNYSVWLNESGLVIKNPFFDMPTILLISDIPTFYFLQCVFINNYFISGMQNLSISCALVCCILLGASAVVGTFGIIKRQISAVLITGVMYILAGKLG